MQKSTSGFTIVELIIVCVVVVVLAAITTVAYVGYQNQAATQRSRAMAAVVAAGAEKYYQSNGGYPDSAILGVASNNGTPLNDTQRNAVASILDVDAEALKVGNTELVVCSATSCLITNPNFVYYVPRSQGNSSMQSYSREGEGCQIQFPAVSGSSVDADNSSYFITYTDRQTGNWKARRSNNGTVTTNDPTSICNPKFIFNDF